MGIYSVFNSGKQCMYLNDNNFDYCEPQYKIYQFWVPDSNWQGISPHDYKTCAIAAMRTQNS